MTFLVQADVLSGENAYALFSRDARLAQHQVVVSAPPPRFEKPHIVRTVELRQQPFAPWSQRVDSFANLRVDWDSYGAAPITNVAMASAHAILRDLSLRTAPYGSRGFAPFSVAPVATGGIKLEWRRGDGALELWVDSDGAIDLLIDRPQAPIRFIEKPLSGIPSAIHEVLSFAG